MNVVFLIADDLNDSLGCYGGPTKTPFIDEFAKHSIRFTNVSTPVPLCCPARTALLTGMAPWKSGVYTNYQYFRRSPTLENVVTMPQMFQQHNYMTISSGKVFHKNRGPYEDTPSWDIINHTIGNGGHPHPKKVLSHGFHDKVAVNYYKKAFDFAPIERDNWSTGDYRNAYWITELLDRSFSRSTFMAYGSSMPHIPWYVPQKYFDLYDLDSIQPPVEQAKIFDALPHRAKIQAESCKFTPLLLEYDRLKHALQGYYASVSFADECHGMIINKIMNSKHRDNTIIILTSDHGFHLGEKLTWCKFKPWERAVKIPLFIRIPGMEMGGICDYPTSLLDIFPTLAAYFGWEHPHTLDGENLLPHFGNSIRKNRNVVCASCYNAFYTVRDRRFRLIKWTTGDIELYDIQNDPGERVNLAVDNEFLPIIESMQRSLPTHPAPSLPEIP